MLPGYSPDKTRACKTALGPWKEGKWACSVSFSAEHRPPSWWPSSTAYLLLLKGSGQRRPCPSSAPVLRADLGELSLRDQTLGHELLVEDRDPEEWKRRELQNRKRSHQKKANEMQNWKYNTSFKRKLSEGVKNMQCLFIILFTCVKCLYIDCGNRSHHHKYSLEVSPGGTVELLRAAWP